MSTANLVVGGGVAGMLAALLLRRRGEEVVLVEKDAACGGLLGSLVNADGVAFDHGAHLLSDTGVAEIDELLYPEMDEADWHRFGVVRAGNWFGGAMNADSPFPDARRLGEPAFTRGMAELRSARASATDTPPAHQQDLLDRRFGATFARGVVGPALRKQLGTPVEELDPATPFALRRVVCSDAAGSRELKRDPLLEEVVAFASYEEGSGTISHRYPREGGIGRWAAGLEARLREAGVEILTGRTVATISRSDGRATAATLDDGRVIAIDRLAWTLPPILLLKAAAIPFTPHPVAPRPIGLFHLVFDRPFADRNYHVTCYDEAMRVFRVTLYPALRGAPDRAPFACTVEVIGNGPTDFQALLPTVLAELATMGIVAADAALVSSDITVVPMGFPATTHGFMRAAAEQSALAAEHLANALLLGRARCPPFFTSDVLIDAFRRIEALDDGRR